jgi:hypothetical protein
MQSLSAAPERAAGHQPVLGVAAICELAVTTRTRCAILVEGWSDQAALEALARRFGWSLRSQGILVVPTGGVTNIAPFAAALGPRGIDLRLTGLYDAAEEAHVMRGLERAGLGVNLTQSEAAALGFHVCNADLEDELIRALGTSAAERLLDTQGELDSFRRFQNQPAQRANNVQAQLRRFMGTRSGRKIRYGSLLVDAIDLDRVPQGLYLALACARN